MTTLQVQYLLAYLGYDPGPLDGILGTKTKAAAYDFQRDFGGLTVDGIAGDSTQAALRHAVGEEWEKPVSNSGTARPTTPTTGTFWDGIHYFNREEFRCKCPRCGGFPVEPRESLVRTVDEIRRRLGKPIIISSGVRCKEHNAEVGGVSNSQHLYGIAADLHCPGATSAEMKEAAEAVLGNTGGIGLYSWGIHVDTRNGRSRWNG